MVAAAAATAVAPAATAERLEVAATAVLLGATADTTEVAGVGGVEATLGAMVAALVARAVMVAVAAILALGARTPRCCQSERL